MMLRNAVLAALATLVVAGISPPALAAGGDVTAVVNAGGILTVTGDGADNEISLSSASTGTFTLTGLNGTTVNLTTSVILTGVRSVHVTMGSGADRVEIDSGRIRGNLRVSMEDGADDCVLGNVRVRGQTVIRGGNGTDRILTTGAPLFRRAFTIFGDDGDDRVELTNVSCFARTRIEAGDGADVVLLKDSDFADLDVRTGNGEDELTIEGCNFDGNVKADTGPDDDHVTLDDSNFDRRIEVNGGGGNGDDMSLRDGNDFHKLPRIRSFEE